jgi:hypothetical protein
MIDHVHKGTDATFEHVYKDIIIQMNNEQITGRDTTVQNATAVECKKITQWQNVTFNSVYSALQYTLSAKMNAFRLTKISYV